PLSGLGPRLGLRRGRTAGRAAPCSGTGPARSAQARAAPGCSVCRLCRPCIRSFLWSVPKGRPPRFPSFSEGSGALQRIGAFEDVPSRGLDILKRRPLGLLHHELLGHGKGQGGVARDKSCQLQRGIHQLRLGHHAVHQPEIQSTGRVDVLAGQSEFQRDGERDTPGQPGTAASRDQASPDLGQAEPGVVRRDDQVAAERQLEPAAHCGPVDGRDDGLGIAALAEDFKAGPGRIQLHPASGEGAQVHARAEGPVPGSGQDHGPDSGLGPCVEKGLADAVHGVRVECVARFGTVDGDDGQRVPAFDDETHRATSTTSAEPMPPPAHMAATPTPPPLRAKSFTRVVTIRAPVAAIGWPRLHPLPLMLTRSSSRPSSRTAAIGTEAKASLISNSSTSPTVRPAFSGAWGTAFTGAKPVRTGSTPTEAHDLITARTGRPCSSAYSAEVTTTAAAASLRPEELPAVMLNPGISGWSGLRAASFSAVVPRRGCSSVSNTVREPSGRVTRSGTISSVNRPSSIAWTARWWLRSAHASMSSREMDASRAVFQPTVMDMSPAGASAMSGWEGGRQGSSASSVPGLNRRMTGAVESDSTPPATTARFMPAMTPAAAVWIAERPVAQCRLCAIPGTPSSPDTSAA